MLIGYRRPHAVGGFPPGPFEKPVSLLASCGSVVTTVTVGYPLNLRSLGRNDACIGRRLFMLVGLVPLCSKARIGFTHHSFFLAILNIFTGRTYS